MAAASAFNGFTPTDKMYVCSVQPEYFEGLIAGPTEAETSTPVMESGSSQVSKERSVPSDDDAVNEEKKEDVMC